MPTRSLGFQSFYQAQLTSSISDTDLTIPLDVLPTPSEGILVIESTSSTKREIIYYTSKTASAVVCPSGAGNGRGYDGTTASSHLANSAVIMAPVAQMFKSLQDGSSMSSTVSLQNVTVSGSLTVGGQTPTADWSNLASAPNTVAANGNRSYTLTFNGVDYTGTMQAGTRVRTTRTVAAPTQCTSLNGTTQYYSKTSPNKLTFTNNFVVSAWIKLTSYPGASGTIIASRYNGTSGWALNIQSSGTVQLAGFNGGAANFKTVTSYQSLPLNKWVHVTAQLDMTTTTYDGTNNYVMIDGVQVPGVQTSGGTAPTSLVQAGNLEIGSWNGGLLPFSGKIAQVAIYNAKVAQTTIAASISQGIAGTETSLASAYSFNNSITDLNTTTPNDLTANGSAVATNADSPYGGQGNGNISSTLDYGIIQSISFSTNTTAVVQVPEGNTIPTSGGVSALAYSTNKVPYGMPVSANKWELLTLNVSDNTQASPGTTIYNLGSVRITVPIGLWNIGYNVSFYTAITSGVPGVYCGLGTSSSTVDSATKSYTESASGVLAASAFGTRDTNISLTAATIYYLNTANYSGTTPTSIYNFGSRATTQIRCIPSNL